MALFVRAPLTAHSNLIVIVIVMTLVAVGRSLFLIGSKYVYLETFPSRAARLGLTRTADRPRPDDCG